MIPTGRHSREIPRERISVGHKSSPAKETGIRCTLGTDLIVDPSVLGSYCLNRLDPHIYDLVLIAGAVAFTDRVVPRRTSICRRRELEVSVPTSDPDFWKQPAVAGNLTDTLDLLTGDVWSFHFTASRTTPRVDPQALLPLAGRSCVAIPFSDGLDSFATERLTSKRSPNVEVIKVTSGTGPDARHNQERRVCIPFSSRGSLIRLRETSYRSRGFVFGVMAGIAAHLLGGDRVIIPESGQGTLGPWLNPVGNEAPDVRMHPFFTAKLTKFLREVFNRNINYEHPQRWKTKGETLRELRNSGLDEGWRDTKSCPRGRKVCMDGKRVQCGVCASCLPRRQSLLAAGLDEAKGKYFWENLSAQNMGAAAAAGTRKTRPNDERQAKCGFHDLNALANLLEMGSGHKRVFDLAGDLAIHEGARQEDVASKLSQPIVAHRDEWRAFVGAQNSESFLNGWVETLRC